MLISKTFELSRPDPWKIQIKGKRILPILTTGGNLIFLNLPKISPGRQSLSICPNEIWQDSGIQNLQKIAGFTTKKNLRSLCQKVCRHL